MRSQNGGRGGERDGEVAGRVGHDETETGGGGRQRQSRRHSGAGGAEMHDGYHESDS